jgi:hypothetical protein
MWNLSQHPLLQQAYDVCQAIEKCGASPELTDAVTKASDLLHALGRFMEGGVLSVEQEPKYDVRFGRLVNRATGVPIPHDEPIMIFRAKDVHARATVRRYVDLVEEGTAGSLHHKNVCFERYQQFVAFAERHPERMKKPDTERTGG